MPEAMVSYRVGDDETQDLTWKTGVGRVESPLQRVRVFDSRVASVHLAGSNEIAYVPSTLQVLADYTRVLGEVSAVIDSDIQVLRLQERNWPALEEGIGAKIFEHLGHDETLTLLKGISVLTQEEESEFAELPEKIHSLTLSNPATLAVQARQRAQQLKTLARNMEIVAAKVSLEAIVSSKKLISDVAEASKKADEARKLVEAEDFIPGTGGEEWQELWKAAKSFIESDSEHKFPDDADKTLCPLCQQQLDPAAKTRFAQFVEFMSGEAQIALTVARTLRNADIEALNALPLDSMITQDLVDLVGTYDEETGKSLLSNIADATLIRSNLVAIDIIVMC